MIQGIRHYLLCIICAVSGSIAATAQERISLDGLWDFSVADSVFNDVIELPGSMLTNGKGVPVTVSTPWTGSLYDSSYYHNPFMQPYRRMTATDSTVMKVPFFLTPAYHYIGAAWYRRSVYVPDTWQGNRVVLHLERPHIETTLWVNSQRVGHRMSLSTPHEYDVTDMLQPGKRNTLVLRVYNGIENVGVGQDSHSVTDQTQGNWNGITGLMELQAMPKRAYVKQLRVYPNLKKGTVTVRTWIGGERLPEGMTIEICTGNGLEERVEYHDVTDSVMDIKINLNDMLYSWDEFSPSVYSLRVELEGGDGWQTTFGIRDIEARGRQMFINGRPLFLRGTVENCCFPETGYPPTDIESWMDVFKQCRRWGLNHVRFHSYCPPEAAFVAADQLGIYLQVEGPSWPNHGVKLHSGQIIDQYLLEESRRIIDAYGNHPSFVFMAAGNEPAGDWVNYCNNWVSEMSRYDNTKLYCGASVGGGWAWDGGSQYHVKGGARGLDWDRHRPQSQDHYFDQIEYPRNYKSSTPNNTPIVAHEQGQWCAFPDLKERPQYTGAYKAYNFDIFEDLLKAGGMENMSEKFLMASGKLQTLCYKYEIERNLRTPEYTGFQLLGLNDYSGQGSAIVGPLNVHWREKGYVTANDWAQFCSPFVPLARFPRFIYTTADTLVVPIEAYNATWGEIKKAKITYVITTPCANSDRDSVVATGMLIPDGVKASKGRKGTDIPVGKNTQLGTIVVPLSSMKAPAKFNLAIYAFDNSRQNNWDFWVYPEANPAEVVAASIRHASVDDIYVSDTLDAPTLDVLRRGGRVLIEAAGKVKLGSDIRQTYLPVFWNTSWFKMRPPHTTGAYIDNSHPLFKEFPTDQWSNLNWWELLNRAQVMNLRELPAEYQSPIQPIDTWHVSRKLGMMVEAKVLNGRLLITTMDLKSRLKDRPVARQMRRALLRYMNSSDFAPKMTLRPETITNFFTTQAPPVDMYTNESPDELKPKIVGGQN